MFPPKKHLVRGTRHRASPSKPSTLLNQLIKTTTATSMHRTPRPSPGYLPTREPWRRIFESGSLGRCRRSFPKGVKVRSFLQPFSLRSDRADGSLRSTAVQLGRISSVLNSFFRVGYITGPKALQAEVRTAAALRPATRRVHERPPLLPTRPPNCTPATQTLVKNGTVVT